jgi:hypothetical protein
MKFCKDCKWFAKPGQEFEFATWGWAVHSDGSSCYNPKAVDRDMVYGDRSPSLPAAMRDDKLLCGPTAKWFEEKEKPIPLCKDCRYSDAGQFACMRRVHNHLTGFDKLGYTCEESRDKEDMCGKYGKWWEKKEKPTMEQLNAFANMPAGSIIQVSSRTEKVKKQSWLCLLICGRKK